jgi:hypothetical protein
MSFLTPALVFPLPSFVRKAMSEGRSVSVIGTVFSDERGGLPAPLRFPPRLLSFGVVSAAIIDPIINAQKIENH